MLKTKNLIFKDIICYEDIEIKECKMNFISGPSGCGKSTLLKLFNKTLQRSAGNILYKDKPIDLYESIALRKEVKLISQASYLFAMTVRENFEMYHQYCDSSLKLNDDIMIRYLSLVKINVDLNQDCSILSGGQKQRVYLAICLSLDSSVIMLDEPTSALNHELAHDLFDSLKDYMYKHKKTMIVVSHDLELVKKYSDHTIHLKGGN